jgi:signal transduction histidine kinase
VTIAPLRKSISPHGGTADERTSGLRSFRPRARLIRLLGEELISDEVIAIVELVKNAYDADAANVLLNLSRATNPARASIVVRDDGDGMTLDTLFDAWLQPATSWKRPGGRKRRSASGRYPLGEKGVGRFAADKLGATLELVTRARDSSEEVQLRVNWDAFDENAYLDEVQTAWVVRAPRTFRGNAHGTLLRICGLRTTWDADLLSRVHEGLARLVSPSIDRSEQAFSVVVDSPDFPEFTGPVVHRFAEEAPYRLAGSVSTLGFLRVHDAKGKAIDLRSLAGNHFRTKSGRLREPACGPFRVSFSVWDLDVLGGHGSRASRSLRVQLKRLSGVSLYRDGFRVAPYGSRGDDWLELNQRRVNNPTMRVSTNQSVGVIEFEQEANPLLIDRTSREGLIDNPAFRDLRALVLAALGLLEEQRYAQRKAAAPPPPPPDSDPVLFHLEHARAGGSAGAALQEAMLAYRRQRQETEKREQVLLRLASAGATAESLLGQIHGSLASLCTLMPLLERRIGESPNLSRASHQLQLATRQLDSLERLFGGRAMVQATVNLRSLAQDALIIYEPALAAAKVDAAVVGDADVTAQVDRGAALQALLQITENAILAAVEDGRHRWIQLSVESVPASIVVRDSGPGVTEHRRDLVFDPYFTGRDGGDGLGLFFARRLALGVGGDISLEEDGRAFRLTLA